MIFLIVAIVPNFDPVSMIFLIVCDCLENEPVSRGLLIVVIVPIMHPFPCVF